jgi:hypothetical protein
VNSHRRAAEAILDVEPVPAPDLDELLGELDELRGPRG